METPKDITVSLDTLLKFHPDAVFVHAVDGTVTAVNDKAVELTGYTREELLNDSIEELFGDELVKQAAQRLGAGSVGETVEMNGLCTRKSGYPAVVSITMRPLAGENDPLLLTAVRDLTPQHTLQDELDRMMQELQHARKLGLLGELVGEISHYYNNIFTGIMGTIDEARRAETKDALPLLRRAGRVANLASGFTRRLLSFSRNSGDAREPTDIGALLADIEDFARVTFNRDITIVMKCGDDLGTVMADPAALHHVLLNLMVNARDALQEKRAANGWNASYVITVTADPVLIDNPGGHPEARSGRYVRISVADTGGGMNGETLSRAFEPFFTTKKEGTGTGLGLATARETIRQYGGWIELESEEGNGTTCTLHLPVVRFDAGTTGDDPDIELPRGTETVLIVDDDEMIRSLGTMTLERHGYRVITASDGSEGFEMFMNERDHVRLIILDLMLPVMSGEEILKRIRRVRGDMKVIISTGRDLARDRTLLNSLDADHYLIKPFTISDLVLSVRDVLDR